MEWKLLIIIKILSNATPFLSDSTGNDFRKITFFSEFYFCIDLRVGCVDVGPFRRRERAQAALLHYRR